MSVLRELRKARGLTLRGLGAKAGVAYSTIAHFESGRGNISEDIRKKLAKALEVPVSTIELDRPGLRSDIGRLLRGGPGVAARSMTDDELIEAIEEQSKELTKGAKYMRGARAEIIAAFALELYNRTLDPGYAGRRV